MGGKRSPFPGEGGTPCAADAGCSREQPCLDPLRGIALPCP